MERAFWDELKEIADKRSLSINQLVTQVDEKRKSNLSSALRLFILQEAKKV